MGSWCDSSTGIIPQQIINGPAWLLDKAFQEVPSSNFTGGDRQYTVLTGSMFAG